ncbi:hypothetical protein SLS62_003664 [Diatrype stigma]|uniref:Uncharacterized protein n=1 Tax=Diatrype stigma TaxID=117547 RepID=A0AAN9YR74_9PEZI
MASLFQRPMVHMEFNWRAQKVLLAMSENLDRRLIITRRSFRAIREVIIGLKKSDEERSVAARFTKTWPPYRQDFDGRDASKTLDDDYSRSVKAGNLMTQEGYPDNDYDRALSSLGGTSDESPTIQTRSLAPKEWKGDKQAWNFFSLWAMKVRATRTINEAWQVFTGFSDERPNFQVYGEMFLKLQARETESEGDVLPGDARETFPIHRGSYSEYELARQSPPTVAELYDEMMSRGVPPEGNCLLTLVRNARTVEEGLRYLYDSAVDDVSVKSLALFKRPSHQVLRRIPLLVFNSYIQLLCRLQPDRRGRQKFEADELYRIRHAIELIKLRLEPTTTEGATFRPPWHAVFRALARPYLCLSNQTRGNMDAEALSMSTDLLPHVLKAVGMDMDIFMYYCRTVQKTAATQLSLEDRAAGNPYSAQFAAAAEAGWSAPPPPLVAGRDDLLRSIGGFFATLTTPVRVTSGLDFFPSLRHPIGPAHLHTHMRTLAFLEDAGAMAAAMRWMLRNWAHVDAEAERLGPRGPRLVARTLCAFRAFAFVSDNTDHPNYNTASNNKNNNNGSENEDSGNEDSDNYSNSYGPEMAAELDRLMEEASAKTYGAWRWPTPAEVDFYVQSDQRGHSRLLQQRIMMRQQQR